jgi:predicted HAD superfamily Cof-like phosphohydrolase
MHRPSLDLVKEFHRVYEQPIAGAPHVTDPALNAFRVDLLNEELCELADALVDEDPVAVLDALTDLQYVLDGAFVAFGLHAVKDAAVAEVHRSNMSKLGEDGRPIKRPDGKVLKGPNYTPPDLAAVLKGAGL